MSLIPDDSLGETCILTQLKEVKSEMPAHLVDTFVKAKPNISAREQIALGLSLLRYADVFSKNSIDLGKFTLLHHRIRTYNEDPSEND